MTLAARIEGVGLVGPGLAGWNAARGLLATDGGFAQAPTVVPAPEALPPTERRRAGTCVRLVLAAGLEAAANARRDARDLAAIFTSSTGDGEILHSICETLASDDREISPTRFHNSVHNAPSGYWGIATGSMHAADCLAAFDASFGAGLLEALGRVAADPAQPVVLVAYDAPYPEPLHATRPVPEAFGVAMVLSAHGEGPAIRVASTRAPHDSIPDAGLEAMRRAIPAARSLPLLALLARGASGHTVIEYLPGLALAVQVSR